MSRRHSGRLTSLLVSIIMYSITASGRQGLSSPAPPALHVVPQRTRYALFAQGLVHHSALPEEAVLLLGPTPHKLTGEVTEKQAQVAGVKFFRVLTLFQLVQLLLDSLTDILEIDRNQLLVVLLVLFQVVAEDMFEFAFLLDLGLPQVIDDLVVLGPLQKLL